MQAKNLITAVRNATGPLYAGVLGASAVYYLQVVKSDLLGMLAQMPGDAETGMMIRETAGANYLESAGR